MIRSCRCPSGKTSQQATDRCHRANSCVVRARIFSKTCIDYDPKQETYPFSTPCTQNQVPLLDPLGCSRYECSIRYAIAMGSTVYTLWIIEMV